MQHEKNSEIGENRKNEITTLSPGEALAASVRARDAQTLLSLNEHTVRFGLTLDEKAVAALIEKRECALRDNGRVEFGAGTLKNMITGFADSDFITQENYEETLYGLVDAFYYFKASSGELVSDGELIAAMREGFENYEGELDAVTGITLETLVRRRRFGEEDAGIDEDDEGD